MRTILPFALFTSLFTCLLTLVACGDTQAQSASQAPAVSFEVAFKNLQFDKRPLLLLAGPETDEHRLYVVEQVGRVTSFPNKPDVKQSQLRQVIDISDKVRSPVAGAGQHGGNEEGLLGMAFHPDFKTNHYVYLHYSAAQGQRRNILSRWTMRSDGTLDPDSEKIILEVKEPFANHNGGHIVFGPTPEEDGYLYITLGDGGSGGDPHNNAQDKSTLLGSILRIDVDHQQNNKPYAIPKDNPFVGDTHARPEIYAYGLRNAWRFSFDPETKQLWAGDVGQNKWEEIDLIKKGGNYGWNIREGLHDYRPNGRSKSNLIDPIHEYGHDTGVSVTGGYVYRGKNIPAMQGAYIFADFGRGTVWMLRYEDGKVTEHRQIGRVPGPSSFGTDHANELYVCCFDGRIRKMVPAQ